MNLLLKVCLFFINVGAVSFGGGYAVLYMLQQEIVVSNGWLSQEQFVNILAIAEMTPGPISVNTSTFVGYTLFGPLAGVLCTLCIIAIPFILSLTVSIFFQKYKRNCYLKGALKGIRPAVVGLIAAVIIPIAQIAFTDYVSVVLFGIAALLLFKFKTNPILVMLVSGSLGILIYGIAL